MMARRNIAFGIVLTACFASGAYAQDQNTPANQAPATDAPRAMRIRVGGNVQAAKLVHQVQPVYPQVAKAAHVSGTVVLHAIIGKDGSVQQLAAVSGPPLLLQASIDAVQRWQYEPTLLAGKPIEVDTTISVVYTLGDAPPSESQDQPTDQQTKTDPAAIDPQLKADILHLFDAIHMQERTAAVGRAMFDSLRPTIMSALPPTPHREKIAEAYENALISLFSSQEFLDRSVALYAKYFSDDDIKALTQFYLSPAGQHFNDVSGQVTAEGSQIGQDLARENLEAIFLKLCKDFPELQGEANVCATKPTEKKSLLIAPDSLRPDAQINSQKGAAKGEIQ
jgi:TonB family protein